MGHPPPMGLSPPTRMRLLAFLVSVFVLSYNYFPDHRVLKTPRVPVDVQEIQKRCSSFGSPAGPSPFFLEREVSDRFEAGTNSTLITNATLLTGRGNDTHIMHGDLYLDNGLVKAIGTLSQQNLANVVNLTVLNANGAWITPGLVDLHTNLGLLSTPFMAGAFDLASNKGGPQLRNIDGFSTHDDSFQLAIAGGVTSALVLPGGTNTIGGEAFMVKLRRTSEGSSSSMLVEPPSNHSEDGDGSTHWRHLAQACGETPSEYGTRPDAIWSLRAAYAQARKILVAQDAYCDKVKTGMTEVESLGPFPEDLKFELLVDVLRGNVKVSSQCQGVVDIDGLVRLTNEFEFPVAFLQHASEAWLVPQLLNRTWGGSPAVALFATNYRYNYPSYRGSEFAPRVLADAGIPVVMKSAHPVVNSRYLLQEAQLAHHYGLPPFLALASVTSIPATAAGLAHRIGSLHEGADADLVMWDSNPLQFGATPVRVWIDGRLQIPVPPRSGSTNSDVQVGVGKDGEEWTRFPAVPDWDEERRQAVEWEGLPPLKGRKQSGKVVFLNVREVRYHGADGVVQEVIRSGSDLVSVAVANGRIMCVGDELACSMDTLDADEYVDLDGGAVLPGMMTFGSPLGVEEIRSEPSTGDGLPLDAFTDRVPPILNDQGAFISAMDALMFGTRNALTAYRSGLTSGTVSLMKPAHIGGSTSIIAGISTTFSTGSLHAMERGAIIQRFTALHVAVHRPDSLSKGSQVSVSSQIAGLRRLLLGWENQDTETGRWFKRAAEGVVPLVIDVGSADIMATLLILKADVENQLGSRMRMVFSGAAEAHILANEINRANVGVILDAKPTTGVWDDRRALAGPPLGNETTLVALFKAGVKVGLKCREAQNARNMRFDLAWAISGSNGVISKDDAYAMVSTNLKEILGVRMEDELVAYAGGGLLETSSKVCAVISAQRGQVEVF
ncbi:carbohydrate esterase family 9 protein [Mycena pura]|uniref:Carbohydrate esterase family 9 protein n=1 Tax=Mycena pura TaxID=153505 RepID=A0AAD6YSL2_9AGAR|nr:carbohydrate esterase family 9 protein [Mycena pura]